MVVLDVLVKVPGSGECLVAVRTLIGPLTKVNSSDMTCECTGMTEYLTALRTLMLITQVESFDMHAEGAGIAEWFVAVRTLIPPLT